MRTVCRTLLGEPRSITARMLNGLIRKELTVFAAQPSDDGRTDPAFH